MLILVLFIVAPPNINFLHYNHNLHTAKFQFNNALLQAIQYNISKSPLALQAHFPSVAELSSLENSADRKTPALNLRKIAVRVRCCGGACRMSESAIIWDVRAAMRNCQKVSEGYQEIFVYIFR